MMRLTLGFAFVLVAPAAAQQATPAPTAGLLIVAPEAFHPALEPFVTARRARLPTTLVALEAALAGDGIDDPERLKRHLFARHRDDAIRYVLLVGDADVLPVRYMVLDRVTAAALDTAFYPSDLYTRVSTNPCSERAPIEQPRESHDQNASNRRALRSPLDDHGPCAG